MASGTDKAKLHGFYRAKVIDNKDPEFFGRVKVWIPDIMPRINDNKGLFALPANNPISGLNDEGDKQHQYAGSSYVPPKGSWIWVFFENENPNKPYYLAGLNIKNTKILPECQSGDNPEKKWVIYKSHDGRTIVISDDTDSDERIEITGKKRKLKDPPTGDKGSVYLIDGNQTTILLDERSATEKLLIRTYQGDYINLNIKNRKLWMEIKSDLELLTDGKVNISTSNKVNILALDDINIKGKNINITGTQSVNIQSGTDMNLNSGTNLNEQSGASTNILASGSINMDGSLINENCGAAGPAGNATAPEKANPNGDRDGGV